MYVYKLFWTQETGRKYLDILTTRLTFDTCEDYVLGKPVFPDEQIKKTTVECTSF